MKLKAFILAAFISFFAFNSSAAEGLIADFYSAAKSYIWNDAANSFELNKNQFCKTYWSIKIGSIRFQNSLQRHAWNFAVAPLALVALDRHLPNNTVKKAAILVALNFAFSEIASRLIDFVDTNVYSLHSPINDNLKVGTMGDALEAKAMEECDRLFPAN